MAYYPRLWTIGNIGILNRTLLGFFCSVKCPGGIILETYELARSLRDAEIPLISGFHSPIEKNVCDLLLSGSQPIVVCPARSIENMRIPNAWKEAIDNGRLLIVSPFGKKFKRVTAALSDERNRLKMLTYGVYAPLSRRPTPSRNPNLNFEIGSSNSRTGVFPGLCAKGLKIRVFLSVNSFCPLYKTYPSEQRPPEFFHNAIRWTSHHRETTNPYAKHRTGFSWTALGLARV